MTGDPLYRPLGMEPRVSRGSPGRRVARIGAFIILLAGVGAAAGIVIHRRMEDDRRVAVARIDVAPTTPAASDPAPPQVVETPPAPPAQEALSGTSVEVQNGVKIIRFNGGTSAASVTIPVGGGDPVALTPAPDPRVSETTADGTLPRIGPTGARASAVYAGHDPAAKGPRIALLLVDLGQDQPATADAARRLPAAVGFGFAPEVSDGAAQVAEARRLGHEAFLDLREADSPADTAAAAAPDPVRALRRRLGRWPGYVGVVLDPGAASASAEEAGRRGLLSIAATPAPALAVTRPIDVVADAAQGQPALAAALARLVDTARSKGSAIGVIENATRAGADVATAIDALGRQPVALVPASAVLSARSGAVDASR